MTISTLDDRKFPMSLSVLWQHWQKMEKLPEHSKELWENVFGPIERRLISDTAENTSDLFAKLQFLAHLARDHDWDDTIEELYKSIEDGYDRLVAKNQDAWTILENAILDMRGVANCLDAVEKHAPEPVKVCQYLGERLLEHAEVANKAFEEIHLAQRTKEHFADPKPIPPEDAQRDLSKLVLAALGPGATVGEVESVRRTLTFMLGALPPPFDPPGADTAKGGAP